MVLRDKLGIHLVRTLGVGLLLLMQWSLGCGLVWGNEALSADGVQEFPTVVVTANKIEESPDEVPIPLTVLRAPDLVDRKIYQLEDLFRHIPNLYNTPLNQGTRQINFRGLNPSFFTGQSPVILMIDGMPVAQSRALTLNMSMVEQVEVLRGAQNTLFGQNAIGGVINITTRKPTNTIRAQAEGFAGSRNTYRGAMTLNGPLIKDTLFAGLAFTHQRTDGFIRNTFPGSRQNLNQERSNQFNLTFSWLPTSHYRARLLLSHDTRENGQELVAVQGRLDNRVKRVSHDIDGHSDFATNGVTLGQTYQAGSFDVISTTGLVSLNRDFLWDNDLGSGNTEDNRPLDLLFDNLTVTQELRIQSHPDDAVKWNVGGYGEYDNRDVDQEFPLTTIIDRHVESRRQTYLGAVFGQIRIPVTSQGGITLGSRFQVTYKDFKNRVLTGKFFDATPAQPTGTQRVKDSRTFIAFLPRVILDYEIATDIRLFASYARGHLPGGFNYFSIGTTRDANRFKSQKSNDYEIGLKSRWWDRRLQVNLNFFYLDIKDAHAFEFTTGGLLLATNAGQARSKGVEIESVVQLMPWLTLDTAIGILNAEYDDFNTGLLGDFTGNYVQNTPSHTIHVGLQVRHKPVMARIDWNQTGTILFNNANTLKQSPYDVVNLRLGYETEYVSAYFTVDNVLDTEYAIRALVPMATAAVAFGTPRTFGAIIRLTY